jgi:hypothetical protein
MKKVVEWLGRAKVGPLTRSAMRKRRATAYQPPVEAVAVPLLPLRDPSEVSNICISMDSPFLQPRYLEQEMKCCPLHLYTSVFGGRLVLQARSCRR